MSYIQSLKFEALNQYTILRCFFYIILNPFNFTSVECCFIKSFMSSIILYSRKPLQNEYVKFLHNALHVSMNEMAFSIKFHLCTPPR